VPLRACPRRNTGFSTRTLRSPGKRIGSRKKQRAWKLETSGRKTSNIR
jgi:hypothetical protein